MWTDPLFLQWVLLGISFLAIAIGIKFNAPRMFWVVAVLLVASAGFGLASLIQTGALENLLTIA